VSHAGDIACLLADRLRLEPHPEGGWYRQLHRSETVVSALRRGVERPALTSILFLLSRGEVSRWHRVLSDEIWHFHEGDPLELLVVDAGISAVERHVLGRASEGREPLAAVPAGAWQAARPLGEMALVACDVGPGFDFEDYHLLADLADEAARLGTRFPDLAGLL
jgi:predicted cupin superfamily sugar epimerase